MTTENRIIKESRALLKKIGASSMTMDMVARNCGISKRTLYEIFPDKKTLIKTCIA
ncbi:MAG: TetR/AcrR family transcriptional regulator, partial [Muribaculaceae bacterium]|nr:TetR/AcrR family transcriptional regulator [Muribaculaceae bacterium]